MLALRTFESSFYTMTVPLDGTDYLFEFRYSQREQVWYFSISLNDGTLLVAGVKVVCNRDLLGRFANENLPPGVLVAMANSNDTSPPKLQELGDDRRVTLVYTPASEVTS